jgi:hypothetical protein
LPDESLILFDHVAWPEPDEIIAANLVGPLRGARVKCSPDVEE